MVVYPTNAYHLSGISYSFRYSAISCNVCIFTTVFSVVAGLLVWFVIPSACSFVSSLELVLLAGLFLIGLVALLVGKVLLHKMVKQR